MPEYKSTQLALGKLILDPNNYRFHDDPDFVTAAPQRLHEDTVQDRIWQKLRNEGLAELKNSILRNGFIPAEPLVVRKYENLEDTYIVLEGNRRLAALQWIQRDGDAGVEIDDQAVETLGSIPVVIVSHEEDDPAFFEALMGVRHVSGIKQWGGYQRAKLVTVLRDQRGLEIDEIADRLAMTTREVLRRYRAFKTLEQMKDDEEYGDHALPDLYALFHEAVSVPAIRDWLGWDNENSLFTDEEVRQQFYDLLSPNDPEEVGYREPKVRTFSDVRELRAVLGNDEASEALLDPSRPFLDAVAIAREKQISRAWTTKIHSAISALESMGFVDLKNLSPEQIVSLRDLAKLSQEIIESHEKLATPS